MLQTSETHTVMCKNPWVDRQVSIRRLGHKEELGGVGMEVEARPDGDVNRSISVRVCFIPALWTHKISVFTGACTPTSGTNLGGILRANGHHENTILPCNSFECHPKLCVGHSFGFPVGFPIPVSPTEIREVLYSNEGIVFLCKVNDLMCDLPASGSRIVPFIAFEPLESLLSLSMPFRSIRLEFASAEAYIPLLMADILSEVELFEEFTITIENGNSSKGIYTNINPYNSVIFLRDYKLLSYSNEYMFPIESEECRFPAIVDELHESAVCTIHCDRYDNSAIETCYRDYRVTSAGCCEFTASWDIEWDVNTVDMTTIIENGNSIFEQVICNLRMQSIMLPDVFIEPFMKAEFSVIFRSMFNDIPECLPITANKHINFFAFLNGWFKDVEPDSLPHFHSNTSSYIDLKDIYKFRPIPPHPYGWGLLGRGGGG